MTDITTISLIYLICKIALFITVFLFLIECQPQQAYKKISCSTNIHSYIIILSSSVCARGIKPVLAQTGYWTSIFSDMATEHYTYVYKINCIPNLLIAKHCQLDKHTLFLQQSNLYRIVSHCILFFTESIITRVFNILKVH